MEYEILEIVVDDLPDDKVNLLLEYAIFLRNCYSNSKTNKEYLYRQIKSADAVSDDENDLKNKELISSDKNNNITLLSEIMSSQTINDEDYVSDRVIDNALAIVFHVTHQPEIFKTQRNSLHLQYELKDRSYLEFEVFENRLTCMIVPKRVYADARFPDVQLGDIKTINKIVGDFYAAG